MSNKSSAYEDYSKKFNDLANEMLDKGIDPQKLTEVVNAVKVLFIKHQKEST